MSIPAQAREGEWSRLLVPVAVLLASVAACSAMPPADAGTPIAECRSGNAEQWLGRAASADIVEAARRDSGSASARLVLPGRTAPANARVDRLEVFVDQRSIISKLTCA